MRPQSTSASDAKDQESSAAVQMSNNPSKLRSFRTTTFGTLRSAWKYVITPTGFAITVYGLNIVAWGGMLFLLFVKAAPAMNHPDGGDADSSPRKIWIEVDAQILNALFCLAAWGLAPWRFRNLYWNLQWRFGRDSIQAQTALEKLAAKNKSWVRLPRSPLQPDEAAIAAKRASPTALWKLDFVVWMFVSNTLLQVGMAFFMWHWGRLSRPAWGVGTFLGLGCVAGASAGLMMWWEERRVKRIEAVADLARAENSS